MCAGASSSVIDRSMRHDDDDGDVDDEIDIARPMRCGDGCDALALKHETFRCYAPSAFSLYLTLFI